MPLQGGVLVHRHEVHVCQCLLEFADHWTSSVGRKYCFLTRHLLNVADLLPLLWLTSSDWTVVSAAQMHAFMDSLRKMQGTLGANAADVPNAVANAVNAVDDGGNSRGSQMQTGCLRCRLSALEQQLQGLAAYTDSIGVSHIQANPEQP